LQLSATGPSVERPAASKITARSAWESPSPPHSRLTCGERRPASRASATSSRRRSSLGPCGPRRRSRSYGMTRVSTKSATLRASSCMGPATAKSNTLVSPWLISGGAAARDLEGEVEHLAAEPVKFREAAVGRRVAAVAIEELQKHDRGTEYRKAAIEAEVVDLPSGPAPIGGERLAARPEAGLRRRHLAHPVHAGRVAGLGPVAEEDGEVPERIAARAHVPVDDRHRRQCRRVENHV